MFGFSLATQLFQGSAQRTWNCVTQFTNLIWYKFNHIRHPTMPRSRRRHHSRSRSRSRSHSHERDREAKRRKIDSVESPAHKRSVSCEPPSRRTDLEDANLKMEDVKHDDSTELGQESNKIKTQDIKEKNESSEEREQEGSSDLNQKDMAAKVENNDSSKQGIVSEMEEQVIISDEKISSNNLESISNLEKSINSSIEGPQTAETSMEIADESLNESKTISESGKPSTKQLEEKLIITPKKAMSPKQLQKKLESEQKRKQKQLEREEREKKRLEDKERVRLEKEKQKQEKEAQKRKEREEKEEQKRKEREEKEEQKRKEREEKEAKRKEKEEREEQKRKERELEKLRKQQELEEKNKEKQKQEEQIQKAAAVFANFFVPKKPETTKVEEDKSSKFMPFQVKSDMRLAPSRRPPLNEQEKKRLSDFLIQPDDKASYLLDLKNGKQTGKCDKTWPAEDDDVLIIEEDVGESICEDKPKSKKMRAKFLRFHENRRPPYYGTWRKKSNSVKPRRPFAEDKVVFDYEVDSDDDWEEEEQGESLNGSDDEEKENEAENEDYEVDNDFFVPHGHLSDDEVDDEATAKLSPESLKQKLKLLKDEFDEDMKTQTHKIKPRSIGCVWYNKDGSNVDEAIDRHLRPLAIITNGPVIIKKRKDLIIHASTPTRKYSKKLRQELIPAFLKLIHGNINKKSTVVDDFIAYMQNNGYVVEVSKAYLQNKMKDFAKWKKCSEEGPMLNKLCWCVEDDIKKKYNVELSTTK